MDTSRRELEYLPPFPRPDMCCKTFKKVLIVVGFEPTPPKRLVPKTSALDHSATLPSTTSVQLLSQGTEIFHFKKHVVSLFEQRLRFSYFGRVSGMETGEKVHYSEEK